MIRLHLLLLVGTIFAGGCMNGRAVETVTLNVSGSPTTKVGGTIEFKFTESLTKEERGYINELKSAVVREAQRMFNNEITVDDFNKKLTVAVNALRECLFVVHVKKGAGFAASARASAFQKVIDATSEIDPKT